MIIRSNIRAHLGRKNGLTEVQYGKEAHGIFTVNFSCQWEGNSRGAIEFRSNVAALKKMRESVRKNRRA